MEIIVDNIVSVGKQQNKYVQFWDGPLSQVSGAATLFINLSSVK
jgi:hypothetical protein